MLAKKRKSIHAQLKEAITRRRVGKKYIDTVGKKDNENSDDYVRRIRASAENYQFVRVDFGGKTHYVAFGVPGPIIREDGKFYLIPANIVGGKWGTHHILLYPDLETIKNQSEILVRIDSGCFSGGVLEDITCDCQEQLNISLGMCVENGSGILIEIPGQDGRGWGGDYKMANQRIMDELNLDTVDTARMFYGGDEFIDQRSYNEAAIILRALGLAPHHVLRLATNNHLKTKGFTDLGMKVISTKSVVAKEISKIAKGNLKAKSKKLGHNLKNT